MTKLRITKNRDFYSSAEVLKSGAKVHFLYREILDDFSLISGYSKKTLF
jgi:hypothetical protein